MLTEYGFASDCGLNASIKEQLRRVRKRMDVRALERLVLEHSDYKFTAVMDPSSRQLFVVCLNVDDEITLIANLARNAFDRSVMPPAGIDAFIDSRAAWFEPETP